MFHIGLNILYQPISHVIDVLNNYIKCLITAYEFRAKIQKS